jgi:hypothetical protein
MDGYQRGAEARKYVYSSTVTLCQLQRTRKELVELASFFFLYNRKSS